MRVLLVDDDVSFTRGLHFILMQHRMVIDVADNGSEAFELAKLYQYDAIIMDLALPDGTGFSFIKRMRIAKISTPILIISGETHVESKIEGLECGADDYLTKPFEPRELAARIDAITRRAKGFTGSRLEIGSCVMDLTTREVSVNAQPVALTEKEFIVLKVLFLRRGMVIGKEDILSYLYGGINEPDCKIIDVFICKLRKKLAQAGAGSLIGTVWGRGYIVRDVENVPSAKLEEHEHTSRWKLVDNRRLSPGKVLFCLQNDMRYIDSPHKIIDHQKISSNLGDKINVVSFAHERPARKIG